MHREGSSLRLGGDGPDVTLTVVSPRIVRVRLETKGAATTPSYVAPRERADAPFDVVPGEPARLVTPCADRDPTRPSGSPCSTRGEWVLREPPDGGMAETVDADGRRRVRASFTFSGEQHFYGLGQGGGELDRLGVTRQLWNSHLGHGPGSDMGVPLLVSTRVYALFFDNPGDATLAVGRSDNGVRIAYTAEAGALTWYVLMGDDIRGVMREVADLLGRPTLPPRWALGFLQSTRHFHDTAELRQLPRTIREKRIPCDALIYLSTYGEALGWNRGVGHLEFQPALWRDPAALLRRARSTSRPSLTSTPCSTRSPRSSRRRRRAAISWTRATSAAAGPAPTIARGSAISTSRIRRWARGGGRRIAS
jgi:hypothetical protein